MIRIHKPSKTSEKKGSLLFIHGVCHGAWYWDEYYLDLFAENGFDAYALDLTRHDRPGRQKGMNQLGLKDYLKDIQKAMDTIDDEPILVGHSMGGLLVQKFLEQQTVRAAVLLASVPPTGTWRSANSMLLKHPSLIPYLLKGDVYGAFHDKARLIQYSPTLEDELLAKYQSKMTDESFKAFLQLLLPTVRKVHHEKIPMLIVAAENDAVVPVNALRKAASWYGAEFIIAPGIAHNVVLDKGREKVAQIVLDFVTSLQRAAN